MTALVFFAFFALYLATLHPALAPYRDAGEMACGALTLSIFHPTSYPLYALLGRLATALPLGNVAFRMGLLSAAAGAAAAALAYRVCFRRWSRAAGVAAALLLGLNPTFWSVALVAEMYTLWIVAALGLAALALRLQERHDERAWLGFAFLFGLCLGNRADLLLWAPGLLWLALGGPGRERSASSWAGWALLITPAAMIAARSNAPILPLIAGTALWLAPPPRLASSGRALLAASLGLSVYLYLPLRSATGPWLDWNHPSSWGNLVESLLRSRYGGTLDLLSRNYRTGELFGANVALYARHLWQAFSLPGLLLVAAGSAAAARAAPRRWLGQFACWWWSGPVFLFMANMPPNPHAAAIVEPHYLLGDAMLVLWAGEGVAAIAAARRSPAIAWALAAATLLAPALDGRVLRCSRRAHLFSWDYARNATLAAPPGAVLVAKKDVQLYTLWYYQLAHARRPDLRLVAQGLAGSRWYQNDWRRREPSMIVSSLRDENGWRQFLARHSPAAATVDCEVPGSVLAAAKPVSLLSAWGWEPDARLEALGVRRGRYDYESQPDFFTADLIDDHAQARLRQASWLVRAGRLEEAAPWIGAAWSLRWLFPEPAALLGYVAVTRGDLAAARAAYAAAERLYARTLALAEDYHALPPVRDGIRAAWAETLMHLGVVSDRAGDRAAAERYYRLSLERRPLAQTHFNLAVLYWKNSPAAAEAELVEALRLDPGHAEARRYLAMLRARR